MSQKKKSPFVRVRKTSWFGFKVATKRLVSLKKEKKKKKKTWSAVPCKIALVATKEDGNLFTELNCGRPLGSLETCDRLI